MEIVRKQASSFIEQELMTSTDIDLIDNLKSKLYKYSRIPDKIAFIEECLIKIREAKDEHLVTCTNPLKCHEVASYDNMIFFTEQELEDNGISNKDILSTSDSITLTSKLDDLIAELRNLQNDVDSLKVGQQITYDDFIEQFENLKKQTYLDKKTWRQVFIGKLFEMTLSGVISDTLSKKIMELFGDVLSTDTIKKLTE
jgi:hypothetical protein